MTDWQEIKSEKPEGDKDTWDFEKNKQLIGKYTEKKENVGMHKSNLYSIEVQGGEVWKIWGGFDIDEAFEELHFGNEVMIEYFGKQLNPNTGHYRKSFKVYRNPEDRGELAEDTKDIKF